jgi:hypothetical protein
MRRDLPLGSGSEGTKLSVRFGSASGTDRVTGGPRSRGRSSGRFADRGRGYERYGGDGGHSGGT